MIKLICGTNGSGKTKRMIAIANEMVTRQNGKMVYIEANNKHIYELEHNLRYVNTKEYGINTAELMHGFICGMLATNYDISSVFVDGFYKITKITNEEEAIALVDILNKLSNKFSVDFFCTMNFAEEEIPKSLSSMIYK